MQDTIAKERARKVFELGFGQGRLDVVDDALATDAVDRHEFGEDEPDMAAHLKAAITMLRSAVPDLTVTVTHLIQEGNLVSARVEMRGHHTGTPYFGVPAQGKEFEIQQFHVIEVDAAGRGTRHWAEVGAEELRRQVA